MTEKNEPNRQHEVDRLRLLLERATRQRGKALLVELEPSPSGFRLIVTGVKEEDEPRAAQMIADYLNVMLKGALRFTLTALTEGTDGWRNDPDGAVRGAVQLLASSPDALSPVPEEPPSTNAIDPHVADPGTLTPRDGNSEILPPSAPSQTGAQA